MLGSLVRQGSLTVCLPDGATLKFGDGTGSDIRVRIHDRATLRRIVLYPELALGEAYMTGSLTVEGDDIRAFLSVVLAHADDVERLWWQRWRRDIRTALRRVTQNNVPKLALRNVSHHYDLSAELYRLFLDSDRQYSCAYFRTPADTLELAQRQKKEHIARKLLIEPGMSVLDIGCGWGGLALTLARDFGARVTGVTLSREQLGIAQERARQLGLDGQVTFRLMDYRDIRQTFDRVVSVGMFEHVGLRHFDQYFQNVHDRLTPDGVALIHTIGSSEGPGPTNPWMAKYIFPGGYIPSLSEIATSVERQDLRITDIEFLWRHYAETLRNWSARFEENVAEVEKLYDAQFVRMWRFYLAACEQTFRYRRQTVFQLQLTRSAGVVPMTRDYQYRPRAAIRQAAE
jgi:cyclopropane-fatty-acyl-phospholipid synthase